MSHHVGTKQKLLLRAVIDDDGEMIRREYNDGSGWRGKLPGDPIGGDFYQPVSSRYEWEPAQ